MLRFKEVKEGYTPTDDVELLELRNW